MSVPVVKTIQGELSYNGFTFPGSIKARVQVRPVQDSTGRFTKHVLYTLTIETFVWAGVDSMAPGDPDDDTDATAIFPSTAVSTDDGMQTVRRLLSENGKRLVFTGKGLGNDLIIDTADKPDISYGPKVQVLEWTPVASNQSAHLVWSVELTIAHCDISAMGQIAEFTYDQDYAIDVNGITTRTITGFVETLNRLSSSGVRQSFYNADTYRDQITFDIPLGFQRTNQRWTLSGDGRRLLFSFTDRQLETEIEPLPGITDHTITHDTSSFGGKGTPPGLRWNVSVDGSFTVAKGYSKAQAWLMFLMVVESRVKEAAKIVGVDNDGEPVPVGIFPTGIRLRDEVSGLQVTCRISWLLIGAQFNQGLKGAGVFAKVDTEASWQSYKIAMLNGNGGYKGAWAPRGNAQLRPRTKQVIGLCDVINAAYVYDDADVPFEATYGKVFAPEQCDPLWLVFDPHVTQRVKSNTITIQPAIGYGQLLQNAGDIFVRDSSNDERKVVHQRAAPSYQILFHGIATRVGEEIKIPKLTEYGGVGAGSMAVVGKPLFMQRESIVNNCKVYTARWEILYELSKQPIGTSFKSDPNLRLPIP